MLIRIWAVSYTHLLHFFFYAAQKFTHAIIPYDRAHAFPFPVLQFTRYLGEIFELAHGDPPLCGALTDAGINNVIDQNDEQDKSENAKQGKPCLLYTSRCV